MSDLIIRGGTVVTTDGVREADVAIENGIITVVGDSPEPGREEIDARGLIVLPGVIDVHLHFNEPGRSEWEGAATGSRAFAAGGGTLFFDMPLNSTPCTLTAHDVAVKRTALEAASITDFALWGGLVPGSIDAMADMAAAGVVGFKAFMSNSGLPEFPRADDATLLDGMREAARLQLPVAVHAESEELTSTLARRMRGRGARDFMRSRPVIAELDAIQRALLFAEEARAALHIVHIRGRRAAGSGGEVCAAAAGGRRAGASLGRAPARPCRHRRLRSLAGGTTPERRRFHVGVGRNRRGAVDAGGTARSRAPSPAASARTNRLDAGRRAGTAVPHRGEGIAGARLRRGCRARGPRRVVHARRFAPASAPQDISVRGTYISGAREENHSSRGDRFHRRPHHRDEPGAIREAGPVAPQAVTRTNRGDAETRTHRFKRFSALPRLRGSSAPALRNERAA
jgi:hypothetical protein